LFSRAEELLEFLRHNLEEHYSLNESPVGLVDFLNSTRPEDESDIASRYSRKERSEHLPLADYVSKQIFANLDSEYLQLIEGKIALGVFNISQLDASVYVFERQLYAIFINSGLLYNYYSYSSLFDALHFPGEVVYFTHNDTNSQPNAEHYYAYLKLFIEKNRRNEHFYPIAYFGEKQRLRNAIAKIIVTLFIFLHEIAHILNGDFEAETSKEKEQKVKEFLADELAFKLLINILQKMKVFRSFVASDGYRWETIIEDLIFIPIRGYFGMNHLLHIKESDSHPEPLERARHLAFTYLSPTGVGKFMKQYFEARETRELC